MAPADRKDDALEAEQDGATQQSFLLRSLVHATYWMDDGLQAYTQKHADFSLPRAQSMALIYLTEGVDRPTDLARKLRVSKQATQNILKGLAAKQIVELVPDPNNGRQKIVVFTAHGQKLRNHAKRGLRRLERELARRIGPELAARLHEALRRDWGPAPGTQPAVLEEP